MISKKVMVQYITQHKEGGGKSEETDFICNALKAVLLGALNICFLQVVLFTLFGVEGDILMFF